MVSISLSSRLMCIVSVMVRFKLVGLVAGGEVAAVVALSFVGVLLDSSDSIFFKLSDFCCGRDGTRDSLKCTCWNFGGGAVDDVPLGAGGDEASTADMGSGLELRGAKCFSKTFSPDNSAGPVKGPRSISEPDCGRFPAPIKEALASKSSTFCVSTSPVTRA